MIPDHLFLIWVAHLVGVMGSIRALRTGKKIDLDVDDELLLNRDGGDCGRAPAGRDAPDPCFRCGAHGHIHGLPAVGRPRKDASGVTELARGFNLGGGR